MASTEAPTCAASLLPGGLTSALKSGKRTEQQHATRTAAIAPTPPTFFNPASHPESLRQSLIHRACFPCTLFWSNIYIASLQQRLEEDAWPFCPHPRSPLPRCFSHPPHYPAFARPRPTHWANQARRRAFCVSSVLGTSLALEVWAHATWIQHTQCPGPGLHYASHVRAGAYPYPTEPTSRASSTLS